VARILFRDDGCGCIEFWHEHPEALGSVLPSDLDGQRGHWARFVNMGDRVACPFGDAEILGDAQLLVGRDGAHEASGHDA
jgi:hypothetical protein